MQIDSENFVEFTNVQKTYDGNELVVKNLNLEISKGEFLTMLGPSGSGKTTCLMMLAGFENSTSGEIKLNGKLINNIPPYKRNIGMVFQNYALFPHMSIYENLSFPLEVRKINKEDRSDKITKALQMVKMEKFKNRMPAQLSGGQQQRIALARSLVFEPDLVLMDEPLGALDKQLREQMQYEIKSLHAELGITVVYVTHDQSEALTMSDRVAVFNDGVIQQLATPDELYERPNNSFVAQFIGENNRFEGTLVSRSDNVATIKINGKDVKALAVNCPEIGEKTSISIRPERVKIDDTLENKFDAVVEQLIYLGDHIRCRLMVEKNPKFIVKIPNSFNNYSLKKGDKIKISWQIDDCRALDLGTNL